MKKIMKSIKRRFKNIVKRNPYWGSYVSLTETVYKQKFSEQTIHRWALKLLDKSEYNIKEKKGLLKHLYLLSNMLEDDKK